MKKFFKYLLDLFSSKEEERAKETETEKEEQVEEAVAPEPEPEMNQDEVRRNFWKWFIKNSENIFHFQQTGTEIIEELSIQMKGIHPSLSFTFGPEVERMRTFYVSANGDPDAFSLVKKLVAEAPGLSRWEVAAFKPRRELNQPVDVDGLIVDPGDVFFLYERDDEDDKFGICLFIPDWEAEDERFDIMSELLLTYAVGEYDAHDKIGIVDMEKLPENAKESQLRKMGLLPLPYLPDVIDNIDDTPFSI